MKVLFINGIGNDNKIHACIDRNGEFRHMIDGSCGVSRFMHGKGFDSCNLILDKSDNHHHFSIGFKPDLIFNEISDPDTHDGSLISASSFCKLNEGIPIINIPDCILNTRRDYIYRICSGIDGVIYPKTHRFHPKTPDDIKKCIISRFTGPVILREAGTHGGMSMTLICNHEDIEKKVYALRLDGRAFYITAFHDYVSQDRLYRKIRFAVIDGVPYVRHLLIHNDWMVHAAARKFMHSRTDLMKEEKEYIEAFNRKIPDNILAIVKGISEKVGLDYFGIDCNIDENGKMLIFEINANMNILINTQESPNIWDSPIENMKNALKLLINKKVNSNDLI